MYRKKKAAIVNKHSCPEITRIQVRVIYCEKPNAMLQLCRKGWVPWWHWHHSSVTFFPHFISKDSQQMYKASTINNFKPMWRCYGTSSSWPIYSICPRKPTRPVTKLPPVESLPSDYVQQHQWTLQCSSRTLLILCTTSMTKVRDDPLFFVLHAQVSMMIRLRGILTKLEISQHEYTTFRAKKCQSLEMASSLLFTCGCETNRIRPSLDTKIIGWKNHYSTLSLARINIQQVNEMRLPYILVHQKCSLILIWKRKYTHWCKYRVPYRALIARNVLLYALILCTVFLSPLSSLFSCKL